MNLPTTTNLQPNATLEDVLVEMARFGKPRLMRGNSGWHCSIDVFVTGTGVKFEVSSDFGKTHPMHATAECYDRLVKSLRELGVSV